MKSIPGQGARGPLDPARLWAARLLVRWQTQGQAAASLIAAFEASPRAQSRAWPYARRRRLRELVFGAVRLRGRYEYVVQRHARKPSSVDPVVRSVLHVALHELCEHDAPAFAVVDEAVRCVRSLGHGSAAGFVNAVLRAVVRDGVRAGFPDVQASPLEFASTWLSHPSWLVRRWADQLPVGEVLALCESNNRRPPLVLRVPHGARERTLSAFAQLEWEACPTELAPDGIEMITRVPASLLLRHAPAGSAIQDTAAQLVAPLLTADRPRRILDLCAAPGGKCTQLAQQDAGAATVFALDVSPRRLVRLKAATQRMDLQNVYVAAADALHAPLRGQFDAVLVDAPCTGTGVLARRHDARWRRSPADLQRLPRLQLMLLEAAVEATRPGGTVVYATCSLEPEENDQVVDRLLQRRDDVREVGVVGRVHPDSVDGLRLRTWPHRHRTDGAFAAVLRRREGISR